MLSVHNASELWTLSFSIYSTYLIFVCRGAGSVSLLVFCQAVTVLGRYSTATPRRVSSLRRSFFGPARIFEVDVHRRPPRYDVQVPVVLILTFVMAFDLSYAVRRVRLYAGDAVVLLCDSSSLLSYFFLQCFASRLRSFFKARNPL